MNELYDKMFKHNIELESKPLIDEYGHRYVMFTFRQDLDLNTMTSRSTTAIINMDDVVLEGDFVLSTLNRYLDGLIAAIEVSD